MSRASMVIFSAILVAAAWGYAPSADAASARADTASAPVATVESFSTDWSRAKKISDVSMRPVTAVDSSGRVHVVGTDPGAHSPLYYLTNASGEWVQSEIARPPRRGAITRIGIAIDVDDSIWIVYTRWWSWNECVFGCPAGSNRREGSYVVNNASGEWSEPRHVPFEATRIRWSFVVRDGHVHFAYDKTAEGAPWSIWYASDVSGNWSARKIGRGSGPYLELGSNGDPWIAYTAPEYAGGVIVAHASAPGSHFSRSRAPGTSAESESSVVDGFDLDTAGRPVAFFSRYEENHGYRTYWVRLGNEGWTAPHRLFNDYGYAFVVDANDRIHFLYSVGEDTRDDGLYYGTSTGGIADTVRIDRSEREVYDGPSAGASLVVDGNGRPRVVFDVPYNDNRLGVWYLVGPIQD